MARFNKLWEVIRTNVSIFENKFERTQFEQDCLDMVKYEGVLYRVHQDYIKKKPHYGVEEEHLPVGWAKNKDVTKRRITNHYNLFLDFLVQIFF